MTYSDAASAALRFARAQYPFLLVVALATSTALVVAFLIPQPATATRFTSVPKRVSVASSSAQRVYALVAPKNSRAQSKKRVKRSSSVNIRAASPSKTSAPTQSNPGSVPAPAPRAQPTSYDALVLADKPALYLAMDSPSSGREEDLSGHGNTSTYEGGTPGAAKMPNGDTAADFNGSSEYLTVPSNATLSIPTTGKLTWEGWVRPDTLQFQNGSEDGYVDWMGKCADYAPDCEWEARLYSTVTPEDRPNRFSAYVFNSSAGLGSGADWQPASSVFSAGDWVYVVAEYDLTQTPAECSSDYPGTINIWVDGVKQNFADHAPTGCMSQYEVTPEAGASPLTIGTMAMDTWFKGAIGKVAVYDHLLSQSQINARYTAMTGKEPSGSCGDTCVLVSP
ncbi:MAG TPA: LamG-like jellyroll fold domain-containing protein [Candidatus Paceibacterota bacterium]